MNSSNNIQVLLQNSADQIKSSTILKEYLHRCAHNNNFMTVIKSINISRVKSASLNSSYKKFSDFEDAQLKSIVDYFGPKNWSLIASFMPNKNARQCRDRYMNYLAPGFIHSEWSQNEDIFLAQKYHELGPRWSKIQKFFPYRTSNSIKNRFNYTVSKKIKLDKTLSMTNKTDTVNDQKIKDDSNQVNKDIFEFDLNDFELGDNDYTVLF